MNQSKNLYKVRIGGGTYIFAAPSYEDCAKQAAAFCEAENIKGLYVTTQVKSIAFLADAYNLQFEAVASGTR